jgi:hypothetical protein
MDQTNLIIDSGASIQSLCGLRDYTTAFGIMLGGLSRKTPSRTGKKIIQHVPYL